MLLDHVELSLPVNLVLARLCSQLELLRERQYVRLLLGKGRESTSISRSTAATSSR